MPFDLTDLKLAFDMMKSAIGIAKDAKDLLPEGEKKQTLVNSLNAVESQTQIAEAQIANALGYQLCRCTFPPQIMLRIGYKTQDHAVHEHFRCPKCGNEWPPPPAPPLPPTFFTVD